MVLFITPDSLNKEWVSLFQLRLELMLKKHRLTWHSRTGHSSNRSRFVQSCCISPSGSNTTPQKRNSSSERSHVHQNTFQFTVSTHRGEEVLVDVAAAAAAAAIVLAPPCLQRTYVLTKEVPPTCFHFIYPE